MASEQTIVIVGASLCGAKAAETLRTEGFDGRVVLIGAEPDRPYERPPLSKTYLRRESTFDDAAVHDRGFYDTNRIELRLSTTVTRLDPRASAVELATGERLHYDRLLLATGAAPRHLSLPGSDLAGIHYLRTLRDADVIHDAVSTSVPVVVIGAGWIGAEVAASARQLGADVTMIDVASVPLERVMGAEVGGVFRDLHAAHGVRLRLGVGIESIGGTEVVEEVRLSDGTVVPAGVVVVGVGVTPRTELAEDAGLDVENGVVTDEFLATSAPGVYAAGDVANAFHPLYDRRIRLEHWSAALNQGPAAAKNLLGQPTPYDRTPYFFSDQYEFGMEYRGWAPEFDEVVFRGDPGSGEFLSFWLHRGQVVAAMNANLWDESEAIDSLVRTRPLVEPARLADPDVGLATLTGRTAARS
jgi:3-phenylpropionate/trans-cinnamate dioxygenase ferredoxin reductase subunit